MQNRFTHDTPLQFVSVFDIRDCRKDVRLHWCYGIIRYSTLEHKAISNVSSCVHVDLLLGTILNV